MNPLTPVHIHHDSYRNGRWFHTDSATLLRHGLGLMSQGFISAVFQLQREPAEGSGTKRTLTIRPNCCHPRQNNPSLFFSGTEGRQDDFIAAAISAGRCQRRPDLVGIVHCRGHTGGNVEFHLEARGTLTLQRALQTASRGSITRQDGAWAPCLMHNREVVTEVPALALPDNRSSFLRYVLLSETVISLSTFVPIS